MLHGFSDKSAASGPGLPSARRGCFHRKHRGEKDGLVRWLSRMVRNASLKVPLLVGTVERLFDDYVDD